MKCCGCLAWLLPLSITACSPSAPSPITTPPNAVLSGNYSATLTGDLPSGCPQQRLDVSFSDPSPLTQNGNEVGFSPQVMGVVSMDVHGTLIGTTLAFSLTYRYVTPYGTDRVTGSGTARVGAGVISGPVDSDVSTTSASLDPSIAVTTSCHTGTLRLTLVRVPPL